MFTYSQYESETLRSKILFFTENAASENMKGRFIGFKAHILEGNLASSTIMQSLPPHRNFELESSRLRYRIFCHHYLPPPREKGIAGDLYILVKDKLVFYKEISTLNRRGKWRLASDGCTIHHPFAFPHRLTVTRKRFLQWTKHRSKMAKFQHAVPVMSKLILTPCYGPPGETPNNPIDIDDE